MATERSPWNLMCFNCPSKFRIRIYQCQTTCSHWQRLRPIPRRLYGGVHTAPRHQCHGVLYSINRGIGLEILVTASFRCYVLKWLMTSSTLETNCYFQSRSSCAKCSLHDVQKNHIVSDLQCTKYWSNLTPLFNLPFWRRYFQICMQSGYK